MDENVEKFSDDSLEELFAGMSNNLVEGEEEMEDVEKNDEHEGANREGGERNGMDDDKEEEIDEFEDVAEDGSSTDEFEDVEMDLGDYLQESLNNEMVDLETTTQSDFERGERGESSGAGGSRGEKARDRVAEKEGIGGTEKRDEDRGVECSGIGKQRRRC
ncbi:hypothetical protein AX774_g2892 [Zancudomyces culisetae]|uniref:Uncharacterized protein n=1 Tax=Zancudomyces culisetae TaxID=1213189 RepID=A0A1R1PRM1_ZANCU|nr:hypothetical protein AX774_g2892 [Zancudomyces culisetae]|eukprot:OMH83589.1 hypothetical protein AX774_g2892 [Zancudomyces culisetae]